MSGINPPAPAVSSSLSSSSKDEVSLSVEETNVLRAKLGLTPLRGVTTATASTAASSSTSPVSSSDTKHDRNTGKDGEEGRGQAGEDLSLSIEETDKLRASLGLPPLRTSKKYSSTGREDDKEEEEGQKGRKASEAVHAPAVNIGELKQTQRRIEDAKLRREVESGILRLTKKDKDNQNDDDDDATMEDEKNNTLTWAARMRDLATTTTGTKKTGSNKREKEGIGMKVGGDKMDKSRKKKKKMKRKAESTRIPISVPLDNEMEEEEEQDATASPVSSSAGELPYGEKDLEGLTVSHSTADFEVGQTTILTLADAPIIKNQGEEEEEQTAILENIDLKTNEQAKSNLRKKRQIEMGSGRAGGYAGYDDDEFAELGGVGDSGAIEAVRRRGRNPAALEGDDEKAGGAGGKVAGFKIGQYQQQRKRGQKGSDSLFVKPGHAVSLDSALGNSVIASDFMSVEEEQAALKEEEEREKVREEKKQKKLFKKLKKEEKKKLKKEKKKRRRRLDEDDEAESDEEGHDGRGEGSGNKNKEMEEESGNDGGGGGSLLDELESTAVDTISKRKVVRKRRRGDEEDVEDDDIDGNVEQGSSLESEGGSQMITKTDRVRADEGLSNKSREENGNEEDDQLVLAKRRAKFDQIMEKGNVRTDAVFGGYTHGVNKQEKTKNSVKQGAVGDDAEDDDAFLSAALAKARRLRRLRELNAKVGGGGSGDARTATAEHNSTDVATSADGNASAKAARGAEAVVQAVKSMQQAGRTISEGSTANGQGGGGGITFEFDETREFTRALRARAEQSERGSGRKSSSGVRAGATSAADRSEEQKKKQKITSIQKREVEGEEDVNMEKLAEQLSDDDAASADMGGFDATVTTLPIGRGVSNAISLLKHTGEIGGKNSGKEELRGRAKDERTYEDYEPLDIEKIVKIDKSSGNEKDLEFANREIKLEYRDEHGRLLTRHEAFRQLCYQFHGYGSSKKNEERRLRQIAREQAEAKRASADGAGVLGALKATQKATRKAFVVHRT